MGYIDFSRSERAAEAEDRGLLPASRIARRLGVSSRAVAAILRPVEWHHTGCHYNETDYYDLEDAEAHLEELRGWRPDEEEAGQWAGCTVHYIEWSGTRRHPKATRRTLVECRVERRGSWFIITPPEGAAFRKRADCVGLCIIAPGETIVHNCGRHPCPGFVSSPQTI